MKKKIKIKIKRRLVRTFSQVVSCKLGVRSSIPKAFLESRA